MREITPSLRRKGVLPRSAAAPVRRPTRTPRPAGTRSTEQVGDPEQRAQTH